MAASKSRLRNYILYACVAIATVGVTAVAPTVARDRSLKKAEYGRFQQTLKLSLTDPESVRTLKELAQKYPASYITAWNYGKSLGSNQQFAEAARLYAQAMQNNPYLRLDYGFLYEYGLVLYFAEQYDRATVLLEESLKGSLEPDLKQNAEAALQNIKGKGKSS